MPRTKEAAIRTASHKGTSRCDTAERHLWEYSSCLQPSVRYIVGKGRHDNCGQPLGIRGGIAVDPCIFDTTPSIRYCINVKSQAGVGAH